MTNISGVNIGNFMNSGMEKIDGMTSRLDAKMKEIAGGKEMNQQDMLTLQYEMGQYQAFMTAMNNTVSALQGHMKEMANSIR
jgi:hypothetical protein